MAPRAASPEVLIPDGIWLWERVVTPKAVMMRVGTWGASQAVWAKYGTSSRCGLMLTLATDLLLWVLDVTNDSMHHKIKAELNTLMENFSGTRRHDPPAPKVYTHTRTHTLHSLPE